VNERNFSEKVVHFLRPSKIIPHTPWTATSRWSLKVDRVLILILGLAIFGFGDACLINAHIGNAPWSVLAQGLSKHSPFSLGMCTFLISTTVLLFWIPLKERPGFGTVMNILIIATAIQIGVDHFPIIEKQVFLQVVYVLFGIFLVGAGSALYITCGLGPGPRDGLMTALHRRTGVRVGRVRLCIEVCALIIGACLGGRVGIGTGLFALLIGNSVATNLNLVAKAATKEDLKSAGGKSIF
jgi:uncharacterized protein